MVWNGGLRWEIEIDGVGSRRVFVLMMTDWFVFVRFYSWFGFWVVLSGMRDFYMVFLKLVAGIGKVVG